MCEEGANNLFATWLKMSNLQKGFFHQNLCHVAMKKIKSYCKTNILLKNKSKNTK